MLLTNPVPVDLSTWIWDFGCDQPISSRVLRSGTISWAVVKSAANSASAADAITLFITHAIDNTGPLICGIGSFLDTKMCDPIQLLDLDSLRKLASEYAASVGCANNVKCNVRQRVFYTFNDLHKCNRQKRDVALFGATTQN